MPAFAGFSALCTFFATMFEVSAALLEATTPVIICKKIGGLWCFDHTFNDLTEVINEPLMHEATSLIDQVLAKKGTPDPDQVHIIFTDDEYYEDQSEVILDFVNHDGEASIYKDRISGQSVWLCPVLQRMDCFHGVKPSTIYVCIDALTE
tara:strand:- start:2311 stop:2760 length:450 start_codon:yes stop_codon:yes gene_type:complete